MRQKAVSRGQGHKLGPDEPRLMPELSMRKTKYKNLRLHFESWEQLVKYHRERTMNVSLEQTFLQIFAKAQAFDIKYLESTIDKAEQREKRLINSKLEVLDVANEKLKNQKLLSLARSATATNQVEASNETNLSSTPKEDDETKPMIASSVKTTQTIGGSP